MRRTQAGPCRECRRDLDAHFQGRSRPERETRMRAHLEGCAACRAAYQRQLVVSRLDPRRPSAADRLAAGLGLRGTTRGASHRDLGWWSRLAAGAAVAASALALVLWWGHATERTPPRTGSRVGMVSKGGAPSADATGTRLFLIRARQRALLAEGTLPAHVELAVAYENAAGKRYLLVYGVDEHRRVYWIAPVWTEPGEAPRAVALAHAAGSHELPWAVTHRLQGRRLWIHSVFLDRALTVRQAEGLIAATDAPGASIVLPGAITRVLHFEVRP